MVAAKYRTVRSPTNAMMYGDWECLDFLNNSMKEAHLKESNTLYLFQTRVF
jgi:hypothetical protein